MGRKALEALTETMFYTLMAFSGRELCGAEVTEFVERKTKGRIRMGPGTLYTILARFQEEGLIQEVDSGEGGRRRDYRITAKGRACYLEEVERLRACLTDAESEGI